MNAIIILSLLLKVVVSQPQLRIPPPDDSLHIYALPVGQGDCTVIQCPQGNGGPTKGVVTIIDAGSSNSKGIDGQRVAEFLAGTQLNFAVITHSDKDHQSYMNTILKHYGEKYKNKKIAKPKYKKPVTVYHPCAWSSYGIKNTYVKPIKVLKCAGIEDCKGKNGILKLCPRSSVTLSFVASAYGGCKGKGKKAKNEDSIISKITYNDVSILITGDFELKHNFMTRFLQTAGADLKSDIYKLSHHGAYNGKANQIEFLDAVSAKYVFSSSGYKYGHPRCEIYEYYEEKLHDIVAKHPYTCYVNKNKGKNIETRKPIYVTSLIRKNGIKSYYLIKFNIDPYSNICVEFIYMNDEK